jgi:hypothetical protein
VREQRKFVELRDVQDEIPRDLGVLAQSAAVARGLPPTIEAVTVDGGAFNVRQGNNSVDLAASYVPRERFNSFVQITGDYRDADVMAGWSPSNPKTNAWLALEASFGNGFLERLENRQQYKLNGLRQFILGRHALTLFGIGQKLLPSRAILFRSNALLAFL